MIGSSLKRQANFSRYRRQSQGHYESFFQRANHPTRPLAFWIRYTIFSPKNHPENALGELWAVFFDGETKQHLALKREVPFERCTFDKAAFKVRVGKASLESGNLKGKLRLSNRLFAWDLTYESESEPLFFLPAEFYKTKFPAAKSLVGAPLARFHGTLEINGRKLEIRDWVGSQNHNWGFKHTDLYAWGQVAGFDSHRESFLEVATARLKVGPLWTPFITLLVLRHRGQEYALNSLLQTVRSKGSFNFFNWTFYSENRDIRVAGQISAPKEDFVCLEYKNPPGGIKHCLNSKIAACKLKIKYKGHSARKKTEILSTKNRAAFEILTDDKSHGVKISP